MGGIKSALGQHRSVDSEISVRIYLVLVWVSDQAYQRSGRTFPRPSGGEPNDILCGST